VYSAIAPHALPTQHVDPSTTISLVVTGGSTTVPVDATSVQLQVTVSAGTANGSMKIYPIGGATGALEVVRWASGQTVTTQFTVGVGTAGKVGFHNLAGGTVTLDAAITGYYAAAGATGPAGGVLTGSYPDPGLALGAVTPGNISPAGGSNGQVLTINGGNVTWQTPDFESALTNSRVVHPTGNPTSDGTQLRNAVLSGYPLIVLEPATYAMGSSALTLPSGVNLIGGGPENTSITFSAAATGISAAGNQSISGVTITDTAGSTSATTVSAAGGTVSLVHDVVTINGSGTIVAASAASSTTLVVDDTKITATGTGGFTEGVLVNSTSATATINNSTIAMSITGTGNQAFGVNGLGPATVRNTTITSVGDAGTLADGIVVQAAAAVVSAYNSQVSGTMYALAAYAGTIRAATSQVIGTAAHNAGATITCVGDFNAGFVALNTTCT
jgi:hypothetical protein